MTTYNSETIDKYIQDLYNKIVEMREINESAKKLLEYIEASKGKYLYCFELSNVTDGKCNPIQ
jgi:hypothetical protein